MTNTYNYLEVNDVQRILILLICALVSLTLPACEQRTGQNEVQTAKHDAIQAEKNEVTSSMYSEAQEKPLVISNETSADMRQYALQFIEFFNRPFEETSKLDYKSIGFFSMLNIYTDCENELEKDEAGYPYIPEEMVINYIKNHFGIENYVYPQSDDLNSLPQYDKEKKAYLFGPAAGAPNIKIRILDETISEKTVVYVAEIERHNYETGKADEINQLEYTFSFICDGQKLLLQAISAK